MATTIDLGRVVGADGITYVPEIGSVTTLTAGENAAASVQAIASQARAVFNFSIPRGADGADGITYTPEIGTVTTLSAGSDATVSLQTIASQARAVFSFGIPRGADGAQGSSAGGGFSGAVYTPEIGTVTTLSAGSDATVSLQTIASQARAVFSFGIPRGADGSGGGGVGGAVYTPEIGTVTTLAPGSNATVSLQTIASQGRAVFSFGIPRGPAGSGGAAATILITFSANMAGGTYTVTDGEGESYTAAVPPSLVDAQSVRSLNTVYTVTCQTTLGDTFSKTVRIGASSGTYTCDAATHIYGFHIDSSESDPSDAVTYLEEAAGLTPAAMNFSTGVFSYGSWEDAFFMPRPCMLKYDGTVDYYLDPDDYTKKADGVTASDVANSSYGGNAMMEWGRDGRKIWYKIVPDTGDDTSASVYIADYQADSSYHCWSFINNQGDMVPHFYTPIYFGTVVNSVLRSLSGISGQNLCNYKTVTEERTYARNNNTNLAIWDTEVYCDVILIDLLVMLVGKTLDGKSVFGKGQIGTTSDGYDQSNINSYTTGVHNGRGLFYGTNSSSPKSSSDAVKVFGMENWWGHRNRRFAGLVDVNGVFKYKMTRSTADGSSANDYACTDTASDYDGYLTAGNAPSSSGPIRSMQFDQNQLVPKATGGSSSTYYCHHCVAGASGSGVCFPLRGGRLGNSAQCGMWYLSTDTGLSFEWWHTGAAVSCKPPAA